jgi:hypothetical protein
MEVRDPNAYLETRETSRIATANRDFGLDVQTPPCLTQKEQLHARAGISGASPSHSSSSPILPQWHWPLMSMTVFVRVGWLTGAPEGRKAAGDASRVGEPASHPRVTGRRGKGDHFIAAPAALRIVMPNGSKPSRQNTLTPKKSGVTRLR